MVNLLNFMNYDGRFIKIHLNAFPNDKYISILCNATNSNLMIFHVLVQIKLWWSTNNQALLDISSFRNYVNDKDVMC